MSSSKLDKSGVFENLKAESQQTYLSLPPETVCFHKNGIEFISLKPIPQFKEMTIEVRPPGETKKVRCTGMIVACSGNRHSGYKVSMVFTSVSRQSQMRLNDLAAAGAM